MKLKENDNVPEIRFDYFKEEWDKKRFKDFTKLSQGLQIAISSRFLEDGKYRYFYITNEFLNPNSTKKYYIESPSENVICTVDDILMTRTGNTGKVITNISGAFHNNFFKVDYDKFETSKMFLYYLLTSNDIQKAIIIRAGNSTIPDLNHSDFYSIKTSVPTLAEQSAIGSLFRTLDDLLASYKDNLSNYQSLKDTMLSKMFPKAGQTVPEIRLDGFEGEWEVQTLKELASFSKGNGYTKNDLVNFGKEIILYGRLYTNYQTVISKVNTFVTTVKANTVISKGGEVIVPSSGESAEDISRASVVEKSGIILGGDLNIIYPDRNKVNSIFLALTISNGSQQKELIKRAQGKSVVHLRNNDLEKVVLNYPSIEEQQAIGSYFSNLDYLINSYQEKIFQLDTLKKKLLQDMFI